MVHTNALSMLEGLLEICSSLAEHECGDVSAQLERLSTDDIQSLVDEADSIRCCYDDWAALFPMRATFRKSIYPRQLSANSTKSQWNSTISDWLATLSDASCHDATWAIIEQCIQEIAPTVFYSWELVTPELLLHSVAAAREWTALFNRELHYIELRLGAEAEETRRVVGDLTFYGRSISADDTDPEDDFMPTENQQRILDLLADGSQTADQLAIRLCVARGVITSRTCRTGMQVLMERGLVVNQRPHGYYRVDYPPKLNFTPPDAKSAKTMNEPRSTSK
jgi:hypothetical protein